MKVNEYGNGPLNRTSDFHEKLGILLKNEYSDALKSLKRGQKIYRGVKVKEKKPIFFISPSKVERPSKNTTNFCTAILSCLPSWKDYPKRSRSIICSFDKGYAFGYSYGGNDTIVLPKNGAKIGVCNQSDYWNSFFELLKMGIETVSDFNYIIEDLLRYCNLSASDNWNENNVIYKLSELDKNANTKILEKFALKYEYYDKFITERVTFNGTWLEFFDFILEPNKNGFKLTTVDKFINNGKSEVWTDSDSILVNVNHKLSKLYDKT